MPWLGDEYFPAYGGEADWRLADGRWVNRAHIFRDFDHFAAHCNVVRGQDLSYCLTHSLPLLGKAAQPAEALLNVPCGHCPTRLTSKGALKEHMQKAHRDILERQRLEYMAQRSANG